jgi:FMN phosphatase YigB (HAD superfamily)
MPIRAVLFDFGHTLVDFQRTEEALREAYEQIGRESKPSPTWRCAACSTWWSA